KCRKESSCQAVYIHRAAGGVGGVRNRILPCSDKTPGEASLRGFYRFSMTLQVFRLSSSLVILSLHLEVCLRMSAYRADLGSLLADHNVAAVAALPDRIAFLGKYQAVLHIRQKLSVSLLMLLLDSRNAFKQSCD